MFTSFFEYPRASSLSWFSRDRAIAPEAPTVKLVSSSLVEAGGGGERKRERMWFDYGIIFFPLGAFQAYFTNVREPMTHQTVECWFWKRERKSLLWSSVMDLHEGKILSHRRD